MYDKLSAKQRQVLDKTGKFVVRACPGSGKTYCVSAKLSKLISEWSLLHQGVATISFTNTAWLEIKKKCEVDFDTTISYPHFLGTIDSFINQFIFLPFGHLVLGCDKRPVMVGEPYGIWGGGRNEQDPNYYFDKVTYSITGEIQGWTREIYFKAGFPPQHNQNGAENVNYRRLKAMKESLGKDGYATQSDANYYAMRILETYPTIRKTLAMRFPWLIIDEAQDTTDIQMKIIDMLISETEEQNIMIVGDPDQAIFEWNNAKPDLFIEKQTEWEDNSILLDESWRSSEQICNAVYNLSSLGVNKIVPVNDEIKDFSCAPEVWSYANTNKNELVKAFIEKCKENGIDVTPQSTVVLARAKSFFTQSIYNSVKPWLTTCPYAKDFAIGKYLFDKKDYARGAKYIEKGYVKFVKAIHYCSENELQSFIDEKGFLNFRKSLKEILVLLPETNTKLGVWFDAATKSLNENGIPIAFAFNSAAREMEFYQVFPQEYTDNLQIDYRLSTIHKVKGETFEAVLLFLKKKVVKNYKTLLETSNVTADEELRNVYVAISRPSKILVIAVPDDEDKKAWTEKLLPMAEVNT